MDYKEETSHTRVPNLVSDVVLPLLSPGERDCLHYVIRKTYGFSDPLSPTGRKESDVISLNQFEHGITSNNYLVDLGTQLSRNTIKKSLEKLEEKELVNVAATCLNCKWQEKNIKNLESDSENSVDNDNSDNKITTCPRCRASLSRAWSMAELTPKKIVTLLNTCDKQKRTWHWDKEAKRFSWQGGINEDKEKRSNDDLREEAIRIRDLLWYPQLVDKAASLAEKQLKSSKLSLSRRLNNFYKPVYELQEKYNNPPLIKYSLEQTISGPVFQNPDTSKWHRYMAKVAENSANRFIGVPDNADKEEASQLRLKELSMRDLLSRAATLNGKNKKEEARALLADILSQVSSLAPLFEGDKDKCENSLREAFKQGSSDFFGIEPQPGGLDFYPEWTWPK